jgi:hypothetical protein
MRSRGGAALASLALAACTTDALAPQVPAAGAPVLAAAANDPARIEVRRLDARPRLTLVAREGDPAPGVAVVFATDLGPGLTTALAAVVESRLRAAGLDADVRVDRDAFRARLSLPDPGRAAAFFAAVASATSRPVAAGSPEIALAAQRLQSLRRHPLDAPELAAAAACTGTLGAAAGEALPDPGTDAGVHALEAARRAALHTGNMAVAAVGPAAFGVAVEHALARSDGWPLAQAAAPAPAEGGAAWPTADVAGVYTAPGLGPRSARLTLAVRVADPQGAAAAAERLGAPDSPLVARLRLLPEAWRVVQVAGVARARGGCVEVVIETAQRAPGMPVEPGAALAAALARREVSAELGAGAGVAGRQILAAADPREAASRAAWWSLSATEPGAPPRSVTALGIPVPADRSPRDNVSAATDPAADARFQAEIARAAASAATAGAERRFLVERGQGELWLLLASPCGVAEEGALEAGFGALATLAALETRRRADGVALDPWITADGIGLFAHAPFRDERETPVDLARRVADAAARAFTATAPSADATAAARSAILDHLEHRAGAQGSALAAFAAAVSPDHPSWLEPFGLWSRVAGAGTEGVRLRAQALAQGPLRVAVLANADAAQAAAAGDALDRWLAPLAGPRVCHAGAPTAPRPGRTEARLPDGTPLGQGLVGTPVPPPGTAGRELAEITAAALDGPGGLLATALPDAGAAARIAGGSRAPTLVIDVRAASETLGATVADVKALLLRLATTVTDADLARAAAAWELREQEARADPRRRLADLWTFTGAARAQPGPASRPSLAAWRAFLAAWIREAALVVVEARPQ